MKFIVSNVNTSGLMYSFELNTFSIEIVVMWSVHLFKNLYDNKGYDVITEKLEIEFENVEFLIEM